MTETNEILIKVRNHIRDRNIKLWLEPYYEAEDGANEAELQKLAKEISSFISIKFEESLSALQELQQTALQKLNNEKAYQESGLATLKVRLVVNHLNSASSFEIKCDLNALGTEMQEIIAQQLKLSNAQQVKCIIGGKIIDPQLVLNLQGVKNNQNVMVIISEIDKSQANSEEALHDRIRNIKCDVERIVNSERQLFQMEDQDGRAVHVPPEENRALLMALGFAEKARMAMKHKKYDEALYLLLEADEKFNTCNSKLLESVDNYALVNLDIVWCYLLLKNVSQLPDAERRLQICERSFKRTYGPNMERVHAIKGNVSGERASLVRLQLLQGVLFFHKNQPNEAWHKFELAAKGLRELKVNDDALAQLLEMGFKSHEIRLALRECSNNVEQAINFISNERSQRKKKSATSLSSEERLQTQLLTQAQNQTENWINPQSVEKLLEMGFEHDLIITALNLANNDLVAALDMLQNKRDELQLNTVPSPTADNKLVTQLTNLGFDKTKCEFALKTFKNNLEQALISLIKVKDQTDLVKMISLINHLQCDVNDDLPTTSTHLEQCAVMKKVMEVVNKELDSQKAYERFNEDIEGSAHDYLDVSLAEEEQVLIEYQNLLTR